MYCFIRKYLLLQLFCLFSTALACLGQTDFNCRHYQNTHGLSHNTVMCFFQDSKGFMWIGTKNGLNRFDGSDFRVYMRTSNGMGLPNSIINSLAETSDGTLWVATDNGLSMYDQRKDKFRLFDISTRSGETIHGYVHSVDVDTSGNVWIVTGMGCFVYDCNHMLQNVKDRVKVYNGTSPSLVSIGSNNTVYLSYSNRGIVRYDVRNRHYEHIATIDFPVTVLKEYDDNTLLAGSPRGLYKINRMTKEVSRVVLDTHVSNTVYVRSIEQTSSGKFWIGTESGVYIYTDSVQSHFVHSMYNNSLLSDNAIYAIFKDKDDGIWIGSYFGGVDYLPKQEVSFQSFRPVFNRNSPTGIRVRSFAYDSSGNLWIGTEDNGLDIRLASTGEFRHVTSLGGLDISGINIQCLCIIDGSLWIATFNKGIYVYDISGKKSRHYTNGKSAGTLPNNDIFSIYGDKGGNIWIGSSTGLYRFDKDREKFVVQTRFSNFFVSDITEDSAGNLWIATYNNGAIRYNCQTDYFKIYRYSPSNPRSICYDRITYIFRDSKHRIWLASEDGGMCLYHPSTETFERFDTSSGLPSNSIYCIQQDNDNMLWLSTNNGLATFNPDTKTTTAIYGVANGLPTKQFNYTSGIKNDNGNILFGSIMGYVELQPEKLSVLSSVKPVVLTGFNIFNKESVTADSDILKSNIIYAKEINLNYKQSTFTINFSTLDYANESKGIYKYMLEGFDMQWNYVTDANKVSYHNIPPGRYTFKVLHMNGWNDTNDDATSITIFVHPPFWRSWTAYIIYFFIATSIGFVLWKKVSNNRRAKERQRIRQQQIEQEERLYKEKINFFISIAHEIRTPVTLIKAPLEHLLSITPSKKELEKNLSIIGRNTERLQNLINQLLDFRKVEAGSFRLQMKVVNMTELVKTVLCRFEPTAQQHGIRIFFDCDSQSLFAQVDEEAMTKIVSNLLTNAIKYGKSYINIMLTKSEDAQTLKLSVSNDGERIPKDMNEKIFDAFVQVDHKSQIAQGTGLGLALTKSLVSLHSGTIFYDESSADNRFVVEIPINISQPNESKTTDIDSSTQKRSNLEIISVRKSTIMLVEDDIDLRTYISEQLCYFFNVIEAENGKIALDNIKPNDVSLVVSDIVMPEMSGLELCAALKTNLSTCDIPVILLTAKATLTDKIEGLENGADAYIEKPFSMNHLVTQIESLLNNRKKMRQNFANDPLHAFNDISQESPDRRFIDSITKITLANLQDEDFTVDTIAEHLSMSRSSFHRKVKSVTGQTPNELIRIIRMNKAAELLASGGYRISEVCDKVGIQSLSHFSKTFQKQFGVLPKDFAKDNG